MCKIKGRGLVELVRSVLKLAVKVRGGTFPNMFKAVDQSQHTCPADQSEHSVLFRMRGFIETGTKQNFTDRLGRVELKQISKRK